MNLIKNKKIAIIGGGPGGLTLARLLQMKGADINIYERDANKNSRMQGATLDLHEESGLEALRQAGLMIEFEANFRPGAEKLRLMDKDGNILLDEHANPKNEIARPEIDRGPLQQILLDSLKPGTVVWDSHFVSLTPQGSFWRIEFKNGKSVKADLVIGADGANSKVRPYVSPIKPFYSGVTALEGAVHNSEMNSPYMHKLLKGGKVFAMGDEKCLILSSKGDGSLVFYTSCKLPENWTRDCEINFSDKTQVLAWFKKEYASWSNSWHELFENADVAFIPRPIYSMPFDQTWEARPNLTLIGDAAHLMTPFAGEGVNMAMQDALELSHCLTNDDFHDLQKAIAMFEKQMMTRASEVAKISMESTVSMHSPNGISFVMSIVG